MLGKAGSHKTLPCTFLGGRDNEQGPFRIGVAALQGSPEHREPLGTKDPPEPKHVCANPGCFLAAGERKRSHYL